MSILVRAALACVLTLTTLAQNNTLPLQRTVNNPFPGTSNVFGHAVAVDGRLMVGASPLNNSSGVTDAGSVYVFDLDSATPTTPIAVLDNPDPAEGDEFGGAVAISGSLVVVGAHLDNQGATDAGRVYVYDLNGPTPTTPVWRLNNPAAASGDGFGSSVAIDGTRVAVGAWLDNNGATDAGSAYIYDLAGPTPTTPIVTIPNPSPNADERFGCSMGISGDLVAVGAYRQNGEDGQVDAGRAYVFNLASATPAAIAYTLRNPDEDENDDFGYALAISGTRIVVGCDNDDNSGNLTGRAYVFNVASGSVVLEATLANPSPHAGDQFGGHVAISGGRIAVQASRDDLGAANAGHAWVFDLDGPTPTTPVAWLANPSPTAEDRFGFNVAISGTRVVVGTPFDDTGADDSGRVYVFAPLGPTVTPNMPDAVTFTSATLRGTVDANGDDTAVVFEYGSDAKYGSNIAATPSPVRGSNPINVTAGLTNLLPAQVYHCRMTATNSVGSVSTADGSFVTPTQPPGAVTGSAANVTATTATLVGSVNPNGVETTYFMEYGPTTAYGSSTPVTSAGAGRTVVNVQAPVSGLTPGFTYNYRIVAANAGGTTFGADAQFLTGGGGGENPTAAPSVTTGGAITIGQTGATLQGTVNPNGGTTIAQFEYGTTIDYGTTTAVQNVGNQTTPGGVSAPVAGLQPGTLYHYRLFAKNVINESYGADGTFITAFPAPSVTVNAPDPLSSTFATLRGTVNPNGLATTALFEYGPTSAYGSSVAVSNTPGSGTAEVAVEAALTGLTPGATIHYRLVASSAAGQSLTGDSMLTLLPPQSPLAVDDLMYVTTEIATLDVIANDVNADTGELATGLVFDSITRQGDFGDASGSPQSPQVSYRPGATFDLGGDSFQYRVKTASNLTAIGTVTVLPFAAFGGLYGGTISGSEGIDGGSISPLTLNVGGSFTITLRWQGQRYSLASSFETTGVRQVSTRKLNVASGINLLLSLRLLPEGLIEGTLTDGESSKTFPFILRRADSASENVTTGAYTSFIEAPEQSDASALRSNIGLSGTDEVFVPGSGFTLSNIKQGKKSRTGTFVGQMPDGEPFSAGSAIFGDTLPLDAGLYRQGKGKKAPYRGLVVGETVFAPGNSLDSIMKWVKEAGAPGLYPQGFRNGVLLRGDRLLAPGENALFVVIGLLGSKVRLEFKDGDLDPGDPSAIYVADVALGQQGSTIKGRARSDTLANMTFNVSPTTGMFSGKFKHPNPAITKPVKFKGILRRQEDPVGRGVFRGQSNAGSIKVFKLD